MSDPKRVTDWGSADLQVTPPKQPAPLGAGSVVIGRKQATAYFDDLGRSVKPDAATWVKVWTPDGKVRMLRVQR